MLHRREAQPTPHCAAARWLGESRIIKSDLEDPHWPCDVLQLPFAYILESDIELAPNLPVRVIRDANATGLRQSLQTRCHIHAIAENVTSIDDDVADIDAHAELDALLIWHPGIALGHPALDINSAAHCVHYAAKLGQHPVSGVLDDPATVFGNLGIDKSARGRRNAKDLYPSAPLKHLWNRRASSYCANSSKSRPLRRLRC